MPAKRELTMRQIRYTLRLASEGISARQIGRMLGVARSTASARGCYVFSIKAGNGYTPYYVGQAAKQALLAEALSPHKLTIYNDVCAHTHGTPVLFFIPKITSTGKYSATNSKLSSVTFLERWLIAKALEKNYNLYNTKETKFLRELHVTGIFNATKGEATSSSRALTKALSL
jgi:hypothetical protein